jgi:predicted acylesterase/phospholipase RssA
MGTILRVGFAVGGGNSLGTFNGAALTQALKLLSLRGLDRRGEPYDRVEVDVFSGSSAGSLSLALMLRGLVLPDPDRQMAAKVKLISEFGKEFTRQSKDVKKAVIAAQILQDLQEEVWIREATMERLLGLTSPEARRRTRLSAGFLDRGAVEELASRYLAFPESDGPVGRGPGTLERRQLLADRVLFAISIANLTPMVADARREFPSNEVGLVGLSDGLTSSVHRDLRVFDLHFNEVDEDTLLDPHHFPRRWCRYHAGATVRDTETSGRGIGSLFHGRVWSKIAATSIASAAFPLAFEPVPLERRSYEFGETDEGSVSRWPEGLKGKDRHVFTYVDGGTFNNEPIREAFRLASFVDAQNPEADFERLVLFVDPHLVVPEPRFDLAHHDRWLLNGPRSPVGPASGSTLEEKSSLDRMIPVAKDLFTAIRNESRVVEADKVFLTRNRFRIRKVIRDELSNSLSDAPDATSLVSLAQNLDALLAMDRTGGLIPAGALSLSGELRRVILEEGGDGRPLSSLRLKDVAEIDAFASDPASAPETERGAWLKALTFASVDRVMDLEGKLESSQLVAISPVTDPANPTKVEELPGRIAGGFGGFMSDLAGEHEVEVARYCTQFLLQSAERIREKKLPRRPVFDGNQRERYLLQVGEALEGVEQRVVEMLADSHLGFLGNLPEGVLQFLVRGRLARYAHPNGSARTYELRIRVPNMRYELDGNGMADQDQKPRKINGKYYLITLVRHRPEESIPWSGPHLTGKKKLLKVDRDQKGIRADKEFCRLVLPTEDMLAESRTLTHPVWVARIKGSDEGKKVSSDRWKLWMDVEGLDRTLLD